MSDPTSHPTLPARSDDIPALGEFTTRHFGPIVVERNRNSLIVAENMRRRLVMEALLVMGAFPVLFFIGLVIPGEAKVPIFWAAIGAAGMASAGALWCIFRLLTLKSRRELELRVGPMLEVLEDGEVLATIEWSDNPHATVSEKGLMLTSRGFKLPLALSTLSPPEGLQRFVNEFLEGSRSRFVEPALPHPDDFL